MKISLVTPAGKRSRAGNRTTAIRWARILRDFGHRVTIVESDMTSDADMMVAVHAWRSRESIHRFADAHPDRPLVVLLAGTDIYRFQYSHPTETLQSMDRATLLIGLHDLVGHAIPRRFLSRLRIIYQSAFPLSRPRAPSRHHFDVCVVGHLREEKDSLRTPLAARLVPPDSRLRVIHLGRAHDDAWAKDAIEEMDLNRRYRWCGEVPGWRVRRQFARSHVMVISSIMEGGANVVSEAVVAGVPVIASHIDGNIGLLGADYAGCYPAKDTEGLARLLYRVETDSAFLEQLATQCRRRRPLFRPEGERAAWRALLQELHRGTVRTRS